MSWLRRRAKARWVHPTTHRIVKFLPRNPPERGDVVLVDGQRCEVLRSVVRWAPELELNGDRRWWLDGVEVAEKTGAA